MAELNIIEMIKNVTNVILNSKVAILFILEILVLITYAIFKNIMNKKIVSITSLVTSLLILTFYIVNYVKTLTVFINNVSTKIMEIIYFPTTLEFVIIMLISFIIMIITLLNKKSNIIIKFINSIIPVSISFLFLNIIEYINNNDINFDEFSVFTNKILMSLNELATCLFVTWIAGLIIYKIDVMVINKMKTNEENNTNLVTVHLENIDEDLEMFEDEEIELPRLKNQQ